MNRLPVPESVVQLAMDDILSQIDKKILKHGDGAYHGPHEGLGIITEEYWELIEAVKGNYRPDIKAEMMDVAVAALWAYASMVAHETK